MGQGDTGVVWVHVCLSGLWADCTPHTTDCDIFSHNCFLCSARLLPATCTTMFVFVNDPPPPPPRPTPLPHPCPLTCACPPHFPRAWRGGLERPFLLDNVWDLVRLLDLLQVTDYFHTATACYCCLLDLLQVTAGTWALLVN